MDFLPLVVGLAILIAGVFYSRKMAEARGKSPLAWGVVAALFSPFIAIPILFFIPKQGDEMTAAQVGETTYGEVPVGQEGSAAVPVGSSGFNAKPLLIGAAIVVVVGYLLVLGGEEGLKEEFQALLEDNDIANVTVEQVETSMSSLLGGRNEVDLILKGATGKIIRIEALVVGSPITYSYIEIPASEMIKLSPLGELFY